MSRSRVRIHPFQLADDGDRIYCGRCGLERRHPSHTCRTCNGSGRVLTRPGHDPLRPSWSGVIDRIPVGWHDEPCPVCAGSVAELTGPPTLPGT